VKKKIWWVCWDSAGIYVPAAGILQVSQQNPSISIPARTGPLPVNHIEKYSNKFSIVPGDVQLVRHDAGTKTPPKHAQPVRRHINGDAAPN